MTKIGYQSGIAAACNALRKHHPENKAAWDKLERTLKILADDHDAAQPGEDPGDPDPPPPKLAPQTYNRGSSGQDAKYCTTGLPKTGGVFVDGGGFRYDDQGLCLGGRSGNPVAGLKPSDEMDGRGPCDPYTNNNQSFPPWPAGSYQN